MVKVRPILLITAAGMSSRFHALGYEKPKFLLPWINRKCIIHEIVYSLVTGLGVSHTLILINSREKFHLPEIKQVFSSMSNVSIEVIPDTRGQAHTASIGCDLLPESLCGRPLIVHNSDTLLLNRKASDYSILCGGSHSGCVDTFLSTMPHYSYVRSSDQYVSGFSEKRQDSIFASSGMVIFSSTRFYHNLYANFSNTVNCCTEEYLSSIVEYDILSNNAIYKQVHSRDDAATLVLGTPSEYCEAFTKASIHHEI
jgi:hypothetical protein